MKHILRFSLLPVTLITLLVMAVVAFADDVTNDIDSSVDATAEIMPLIVGGPNGSTKLYVVPLNGDGKNGCNLTGSTTLVVSVNSSNTSVATVSPSSITFTSCGVTPTLTITPVAVGSANITLSQVSNNTGATFNLAASTFTVNVTPPPNTPPNVSVTGVIGGASYELGAVPAAGCSVSDAEDGDSTFAATLSPVSGPLAAYGLGTQTAGCSYSDAGGLTASSSVTYGIVDTPPPTSTITLGPATPNGSNGWYVTNVKVTVSAADNVGGSGVAAVRCVLDPASTPPSFDDIPVSCAYTGAGADVTTEGSHTFYAASKDNAGNKETPKSTTFKLDKSGPSAALAVTAGTLGENDWYTSDVTVSTLGADSISSPVSCTADQFQTTETTGAVFNGSCTNAAGLSTDATPLTVRLDKSAPTNITFIGSPSDGASYYFGSVPAAPTCSADGAISGLLSCIVSGYGTSVGSYTLTAMAKDNAGNRATATLSYTVLVWTINGFYHPVDMSPAAPTTVVWNSVKNGATVPLKFEVFAGPTELTDTAILSSLSKQVTCNGGTEDTVEVVATGGTSLRYDTTAGQFIYNWQTPKLPGKCYSVTMTTTDGSSITAYFKLK